MSDSFAPPENMASAFFSRQHKSRDGNKEILTCDYCHWTGHTNATCYKLVGYPPGHKYYKGKPQGHYHRQSKNFFTEHSKGGYANMTVTTADASVDHVDKEVPGGAIFTPAQSAEILKLLNKDSSQGCNVDYVVNMEGNSLPHSPTRTTHWIIDSGVNDHMVGKYMAFSLSNSIADSTLA